MPPTNFQQLPALPIRKPDSHKGSFGRVLVIAGSAGMMGSGAMASLACLRSGCGVVLWALPKALNVIGEAQNPEVMTLPIPDTPSGAPSMDAREILVEAARETDCVVLGPGLPVAGDTGELMRLLIPEIFPPLILDGGAFSAIGTEYMIIRKRQSPTIITPHPGEMSRITGRTTTQIQEKRSDFAVKYAKHSGAVVALKGYGTVVTDGAEVYVNESGNPALSTAGSGDVLCGVIASLVGQGFSPFEAAKLGVYLHGLSGDLAARDIGDRGVIARDIIDRLPLAFKQFAALRGAAANDPK